MLTVKTATGREIECDAFIAATQYPVLNIHTHSIDGSDAWAIFNDPEETKVLRKMEDGEEVAVYRNYTVLQSIQRSPFINGDILIWLNFNMEVD